MRQVKTDRHQVLRFVGGIAKHHTLVASALLVFVAIVHATIDVIALLMDSSQDTTRVAVKLVLCFSITYLLDGVSGNGLQVDIHLATHLAHDDDLACGDKRLTSHTGIRIVGQELVENSVTYLISHLVGMAF